MKVSYSGIWGRWVDKEKTAHSVPQFHTMELWVSGFLSLVTDIPWGHLIRFDVTSLLTITDLASHLKLHFPEAFTSWKVFFSSTKVHWDELTSSTVTCSILDTVTQARVKWHHLRVNAVPAGNKGQGSGDLTLASGSATWLSERPSSSSG